MEFLGRSSVNQLKSFAKGKILLFTTKGNHKRFAEILNSILYGLDVTIFEDITPNTKYDEIIRAQELFSDIDFDTLIAFGGGSVIDFAKAFKFYNEAKIPLIAIPTTAGTGSETTQFAVVYVNGEKTSIDKPEIKPDIAIVDSQFIENSPRYLKACAGMDAFCHAIESYWAKRANEESKCYALEAINLCRDHLSSSVNTSDLVSNEKMSLAAHLAGKAINITRTTASHALSYKITSMYGIPHGHAVALTIAGLFNFNIHSLQDGDRLCKALGIREDEFEEYVRTLMSDIGLEYDVKKLGIFDVKAIVDSVNVERLSNNPKELSKLELVKLF